jgi:hypothetical protein
MMKFFKTKQMDLNISSTKIKFIFLVGVEGTGHSMIRSILKPIIGQPYFVDQGEWHSQMMTFWDPDATLKQRFKGKRAIEKSIKKYCKDPYTHLLDTASFPYNQPRNALRRFDIIELIDVLKDFCEVRLLVLYRDPISTAYSGIRRGFVKHPYLQAQIVEDNFIFISSQLSQISPELYKILIFEDFLDHPESHIKLLSQWWGLDRIKLQEGIKYLKSPTPSDEIPVKIKQCLSNFFTPERINQWPLLTSVTNRLRE